MTADRITGPSREATAELIARLAGAGRDDPRIAERLGMTPSQVRGIRRQFGIPAGEQRWLPLPETDANGESHAK